MKRLLLLLVSFVYLATATGASLHFHYCCGKLKEVDLSFTTRKSCSEGDHKMGSKPCCQNKAFSLQIDEDQAASKQIQPVFHTEFVKPVSALYPENIAVAILNPHSFNSVASLPDKDRTHLFCVYRI